MNFLGHLYFSNNDLTIMNANLFGDFVKGSDLSKFPEIVKQGIILHRKIDDFIDNHSAVIDLRHKINPELPKVSSIAIDLFFDYFLAKKWDNFHEVSLSNFILEFSNFEDHNDSFYSKEFKFVRSKMIQQNWLLNYRKLAGLDFACRGLSRRISFENHLKFGVNVLLNNYEEVENAFEIFMHDARKIFY